METSVKSAYYKLFAWNKVIRIDADLYDAIGARVVLQTTDRRPLTEGDLSNAYLPETYRLEALRKIHGDLNNRHGTVAAIRIELTEGEWTQVAIESLSRSSSATHFIINCKQNTIIYFCSLFADLSHSLGSTTSTTHCAAHCFVHTKTARHLDRH